MGTRRQQTGMVTSRPLIAGGLQGSDPDHDRTVRYLSVEEAAVLLSTTPVALRHRLRRAQQLVGRVIVADLGVAEGRKMGSSWRVRIL